MSSRNLRFFRVGLPFFSIVLGGAYGLHYFQQVRYDFRKIQHQRDNIEHLKSDLENSGVRLRKNVTTEEIYKEIARHHGIFENQSTTTRSQ
ncbi:Cytochrome oxidase assembly [Parelaphostrongylus tenuis]|uniref:Cytochrome c oxidase assembly protein COX16 homolog, mitochondrial n=1 Tax=Parelaphostrongylus tenuis TaxID=148309 RepID=A0AAD5LUI1_PARTN|nr:Cytochrome oxidase assembly [Parelaphostrongylus tenuis]